MSNPETKPTCKGMTRGGGHRLGAVCTRVAKRDGYCAQHHPDAKKPKYPYPKRKT